MTTKYPLEDNFRVYKVVDGKIGLWTKADACSSFDDLILAEAHEKGSKGERPVKDTHR